MEMRQKIELEEFVNSKRQADIQKKMTPEEIEVKKRLLKESVHQMLLNPEDESDFES